MTTSLPHIEAPQRSRGTRTRRRVAASTMAVALLLAACGGSAQEAVQPAESASSATPAATSDGTSGATGAATADTGLWDAAVVHTIAIAYDRTAYDEMIATFTETGDKDWIEATVTIDGTTYEHVGLRLKGNSTLQGLRSGAGGGGQGGPGGGASADEPEALPWLIRLDKYVEGQAHEGTTDLVVRANNSETSLNEAVALELVGLAGLATQEAVATRFSVNGGDEVLRLAVQLPEDTWLAAAFDDEGVLFKAESGGDWSYRGDDPTAYADVFEQETDTDDEDLTPLIELLEFLNTSDDATFSAELADHLDVEAFARYLATMELLANTDDIDGPGNNAYLYYDSETERFTVVTWDLNLAFGSMGGGAGGGFGGPGGDRPAMATADAPTGRAGGGMGGRSNVLVERFLADETFAALYATALGDLGEQLYTSGAADEVLARWTAVLQEHTTDLVDAATITSEAARIAAQLSTS